MWHYSYKINNNKVGPTCNFSMSSTSSPCNSMILDLTGSMSLAYRHLNYDLKLDESPPYPPPPRLHPSCYRSCLSCGMVRAWFPLSPRWASPSPIRPHLLSVLKRPPTPRHHLPSESDGSDGVRCLVLLPRVSSLPFIEFHCHLHTWCRRASPPRIFCLQWEKMRKETERKREGEGRNSHVGPTIIFICQF